MGRRKKSETPKQFSLMDVIAESTETKPDPQPEVQKKPKKQKKVSEEPNSSDYVVRKYTGRTTCGFIHNHKYLVKLTKNADVGFTVWAIEDVTEEDEVNIGLKISSENSWNHFFIAI